MRLRARVGRRRLGNGRRRRGASAQGQDALFGLRESSDLRPPALDGDAGSGDGEARGLNSTQRKSPSAGRARRTGFCGKIAKESDFFAKRVRLPPGLSQGSAPPAKMRCDGEKWRPRRESNPCTRICSPLRSHSATRPLYGGASAIDNSRIAASGGPPQDSRRAPSLFPLDVVKKSFSGFSIRNCAAIRPHRKRDP